MVNVIYSIFVQLIRKHPKQRDMTSECLPTVIEDTLHEIIDTNKFQTNAKLNYTEIITNTISSSCKINIVDNSGKELNLFIKYLNNNSDKKWWTESLLYFNNEYIFYSEFLKIFPINNDHFTPKCYHLNNSVQPFIIMEDITSSGYKTLNINQPIKLEYVRLILKQLGRFHAYSFAGKIQNSNAFTNATSSIKETVFRRDGPLAKLFIHSIHDVLKLAKQSLPTQSEYVEKFATFTLNVFERMVQMVEGLDEDDIEYKVITHGDLWPSNILLKYDEECVKFIDYQACRYSSPVHDLMLIILLMLDKTTREEHRDELIRLYYHRSLCETLVKLNLDPLRLFPYSALQNQLLKHTKFAMALALVGLPLYLNEGLNSRNGKTVAAAAAAAVTKLSGHDDNNKNTAVFASNSSSSNLDSLFEFVQDIQTRKTMQCKNKMLEIIMDVVDQGYL